MDPIQLALDTSTARPLAAVLRGSTVLAEWSGPAGTSHSETLLSGIDECIKASGIALKDMNFLSCGVGPGMFTGLRVGVATAQFLADSLGVNIAPVSSLLALALGAKEMAGKRIWALNDAKSGRVYALCLEMPKGEEEAALDPKDLANQLRPGDILVGEGAAIYRDLWPQEVTIAAEPELFLRAGYVGRIGHAIFTENKLLAPQKVLPRYLKTQETQRHL